MRLDGEWKTNFPPPDGFFGVEEGVFGLDAGYRRQLSDDELDIVEAQQAARAGREEVIARRLYAEVFEVGAPACPA